MAKVKVFQLDDDPDQIKLCKTLCASQNDFEYFGFSTVKEFLTTIKDQAPSVCIIDLNLDEGKGAGFVVLEAIRNKYSHDIPIFILSRRSAQKDITYALELGATDYILKPLDPLLVQEKIKSYLSTNTRSELPVKQLLNPIKGILNLQLKLLRMDENYIYVESDCFFKKHLKFELNHEVFGKIFGIKILEFRVHDCELAESTGRYLLKLVAVKDTEEYYQSISRYLKQGSK